VLANIVDASWFAGSGTAVTQDALSRLSGAMLANVVVDALSFQNIHRK
jgi:hypothetical protein